MLVALAGFFAGSAGTARTAGIVLALIGGVMLVQVVANVARVDLDLMGKLQLLVLYWPGPLAILTGRWLLVAAWDTMGAPGVGAGVLTGIYRTRCNAQAGPGGAPV